MTMKKFFIAAVAALALLNFVPSRHPAEAQTKTLSVSIPTPSSILQKFNAVALSDLQRAEAIAKAANDTIADQCYVALIGLSQQMQTVASGSSASSSGGVVTEFQKARMLVQAQQSTSPIFTACAPLVAQVKQQALQAPAALLALF